MTKCVAILGGCVESAMPDALVRRVHSARERLWWSDVSVMVAQESAFCDALADLPEVRVYSKSDLEFAIHAGPNGHPVLVAVERVSSDGKPRWPDGIIVPMTPASLSYTTVAESVRRMVRGKIAPIPIAFLGWPGEAAREARAVFIRELVESELLDAVAPDLPFLHAFDALDSKSGQQLAEFLLEPVASHSR